MGESPAWVRLRPKALAVAQRRYQSAQTRPLTREAAGDAGSGVGRLDHLIGRMRVGMFARSGRLAYSAPRQVGR